MFLGKCYSNNLILNNTTRPYVYNLTDEREISDLVEKQNQLCLHFLSKKEKKNGFLGMAVRNRNGLDCIAVGKCNAIHSSNWNVRLLNA